MGCHFLLQGSFLTQRLNPGLPNSRQTLYLLSHQASYLASLRLLSIYSRRRWERLSGHRPLCLLLHWMMLRTVALKLYCTLKCLQCSEISPSSGCIADQLNQNACEWALSGSPVVETRLCVFPAGGAGLIPDSLFSWAPKSLQMVTAAMKLKDTCSLEEKL